MTRSAFVTAILISGVTIMAPNRPAVAQETSLEKSKTILQSIEQKRPDYIALIQDVSGSMLTNGMMTSIRQQKGKRNLSSQNTEMVVWKTFV